VGCVKGIKTKGEEIKILFPEDLLACHTTKIPAKQEIAINPD